MTKPTTSNATKNTTTTGVQKPAVKAPVTPPVRTKKTTPSDAPECFGKYPKDTDPGKVCRACKFHKACK